MQTSALDFEFPVELIATEPRTDFRILLTDVRGEAADVRSDVDVHGDVAGARSVTHAIRREITRDELFAQFAPGDLLVINDTKVVKRRVFAGELEILFIERIANGAMPDNSQVWSVLFPARDLKIGDSFALPGGLRASLLEKGLPQKLKVNGVLDDKYFAEHAEYALPPYIQKARNRRHSQWEDENWYQTAWARAAGSCAAPTASLHFQPADLEELKKRGVRIEKLTLHVGIGTFLPVKTENLAEHKMHKEHIEIPAQTIAALKETRAKGRQVWALGTTVARALESYGQNMLRPVSDGVMRANAGNDVDAVYTGANAGNDVDAVCTGANAGNDVDVAYTGANASRDMDAAYVGASDLFIRPGYEWQWVDGLLTNFHQPKSTLLALVAAFAGLENVLATYRMAVEKRFRLFSYGDLSVWRR